MANLKDLSIEEKKAFYIDMLSGHEREDELISIIATITAYKLDGALMEEYFSGAIVEDVRIQLTRWLLGLKWQDEDHAWKLVIKTIQGSMLYDILSNPEKYITSFIETSHDIYNYRDMLYKQYVNKIAI